LPGTVCYWFSTGFTGLWLVPEVPNLKPVVGTVSSDSVLRVFNEREPFFCHTERVAVSGERAFA
jgi:hypothetical protein